MTDGYRRFLPACLLGLVSVLPLAGNRCGAEEVFDPYLVYVDQEGVTARCGPGGDYYRTDPLRHGQRLEVYLETADGWLGIRPPEGSFCWVPADSVKLDRGESAGQITEEATLAWIGTHLGKARKYLWQIQMPRGEDVTILGRAEREGPDGPQLWYRIVPPSGEFRWVHRDQVVDNPELLLREKPRGEDRLATGTPTLADESMLERAEQAISRQPRGLAAESILQRSSTEEPNQDRSADHAPVQLHALHAPDAIPLATVPHAVADSSIGAGSYSPLPAAYGTTDPYIISVPQVIGSSPVGSGIARREQPPLMTIASQPIVRTIGATSDETPTLQTSDANWVRGSGRPTPAADRRDQVEPGDAHRINSQTPAAAQAGASQAGGSVEALQLELTRRMVASSRASELEPLRLAAEEIVRNHASPTERQRAQLLAQRVEQFQAVARRRDGQVEANRSLGAPNLAQNGGFSHPVTSGQMAPSGQVMLPEGGVVSGEVAGYLVQVYSARPDSPPFALTDASGRTTHYVSPSPGVNLRRYLNQHISIAGQSGYDTGLDTPHIIASGAVRSPQLR